MKTGWVRPLTISSRFLSMLTQWRSNQFWSHACSHNGVFNKGYYYTIIETLQSLNSHVENCIPLWTRSRVRHGVIFTKWSHVSLVTSKVTRADRQLFDSTAFILCQDPNKSYVWCANTGMGSIWFERYSRHRLLRIYCQTCGRQTALEEDSHTAPSDWSRHDKRVPVIISTYKIIREMETVGIMTHSPGPRVKTSEVACIVDRTPKRMGRL